MLVAYSILTIYCIIFLLVILENKKQVHARKSNFLRRG